MALAIKRTLSEHLKATGNNSPLDSFVLQFENQEVKIRLVSRINSQVRIAIEADDQVKIIRSELLECDTAK